MLIFLLAVSGAALAHRYLQVYAPSNAIVARVRRRRPRLRVAAGLFALSTTLASTALALAEWVINGGPGWLNLVIVVAIWDAFKFTFMAIAVALRCAGAVHQAARHQNSVDASRREPRGSGQAAPVHAQAAAGDLRRMGDSV